MKKAMCIVGTMLVMAVAMCGCGVNNEENTTANLVPIQEVEPTADMMDTSYIEDYWCGGFSDGPIRMIGGWVYEQTADGCIVEDEQGNLWEFYGEVADDDFLLLWIVDSNTPNDVTDDYVLKLWAEVH